MSRLKTYLCLTCGMEADGRGQGFSCEGCGGAAFLVGPLDPPSVEVHLRRMRVDEAMPKLDRYLNTAFLAGLAQVRIVHGKGTGTLRNAVVEVLESNPLIRSHRGAELAEGGAGVTVAELALY